MTLSTPITPLNTNTPITPIHSTSTSLPSTTPLRVLCFGDSLTEGYSQGGQIMAPYSFSLEQQLKKSFPDREITVDVDGVSGDLMTPPGGFLRRLERRFSASNPAPYTHTLFLGGTNDLGWGKSTAQVISTLTTLVNIPLSHSSKVLLFTIPECSSKIERLDTARDQVNNLMKLGVGSKEGVEIFDLKSVMPYHTMSAEDVHEFWDDGLHFTTAGYEKMGEEAAKRFVEVWGEELGAIA